MERAGSVETTVEQYSRLLFQEASDGVFIAGPDGIYVNVNPSGHRMLGYENGELVGKHISTLVLERDRQRLEQVLALVKQGQIESQIWPLLRKDGQIMHLEVQAQQLSTGALLAITRDLTGRSEFERKIQASEAKLGSILHTAPDVILMVDRQGTVLFLNRALPPLTIDQVVGTSCYDYVPAEARARVARAIGHVFETGTLDQYEVLGPPDGHGQRSWVSVRVGPQIEGGRVVAATMCATDVSAYKQETARTQELLERLGKIASLVPGVVCQFQLRADGSLCFPYASERIREVFRVTKEQVREDAAPIFAVIHAQDRAGVLESLRASARSSARWHREFRVAFPNGDERWLAGNAVPEAGVDASTLWHGLFTDVSDRKQADAAKAKLEEQLMQAQKMESVGQLAGGVAHDFNNLLTAVVAFVDLAQDELPENAPVREHLRGILGASERGAALTQQLLAFARKKIVQPRASSLNDILTRLAPMMRRLVGEHITVDLDLAQGLGTVLIDVGSLEQVIMNLIVNARDAMPEGGRLTLETRQLALDAGAGARELRLPAGPYIVLGVTDTGSGIAPEVRAHLFEPFFTTKPPGAGTGLGLAMCHGIIRQAGGSIAVHSVLGQGATFRIHLPSHSSRPVSTAPPEQEQPRALRGHERVLVVDDEAAILRVARTALERLGYRVCCASNGVEALELAAKLDAPLDLLVTDVVMPQLGGKELSSRLRELNAKTKVLYTSGYADNAIARGGMLLEGVNFLQKPYTLAALAKRVREVLDGV